MIENLSHLRRRVGKRQQAVMRFGNVTVRL